MVAILYAEDDASLRNFFSKALEKAGHQVCACANGVQALKALKFGDDIFELLLTDIMMPDMDGITLAKQAEILSPNIKVIFITGFAAVALNNGKKAHQRLLSKPVHLRELISEIDRFMTT